MRIYSRRIFAILSSVKEFFSSIFDIIRIIKAINRPAIGSLLPTGDLVGGVDAAFFILSFTLIRFADHLLERGQDFVLIFHVLSDGISREATKKAPMICEQLLSGFDLLTDVFRLRSRHDLFPDLFILYPA